MLNAIKRSISNKLMLVAMVTTFVALLAYGVVMFVYDLRVYHDSFVRDLTTQANIIAEVSAPALEFDDPVAAKHNLELLRTRPLILSAALYTGSGKRFSQYSSGAENDIQWPAVPPVFEGYSVKENRIEVWQPVIKDRRVLGTVYISARYEVHRRMTDYAFILICVLSVSLGIAILIASWLRGALTKPIFAVTEVARRVMQSRDFSLRAKKFTEDEIGVLVDAFNDMLGEVERRAKALEESNRFLEYEMSERQAAEDALRLADRRKDEFLATLAHELRNPLAPISNSLSILRLAQTNPKALAAAQDVMERQLKQMVRLVDDLLDVSRITTGKLTITKIRVDVQAVMRDAVETSSAFIKSFQHQLNVEIPDDPIYINADPIRLAQVFSNLLNNAAKYTNPSGQINFSAQVVGTQVLIKISDNGIGLAPDMLKDIFNMFTQVDQSLERAHAGLGVGLALSKHLVELHGGDLTAESQGQNLGSTFTVRLDVAPQRTRVTEEIKRPAEVQAGRRKILLVDDNVDFVVTMAALLNVLGHEVRTAHEGETAQQIAREFLPDFAFLDIGMPGLNGYDLARLLRKIAGMESCVLVAVTGWGQEKDRQMSRDAGFNHHLVKPVELARILEVIASYP